MDNTDQAPGTLAPDRTVVFDPSAGVFDPAAGERAAVDSTIDAVARKVAETGLAMPAVFLLELNKPLATVVYTAALAFEPISGALFGLERAKSISALLSNRENIEALICKIEAYSAAVTKQARL